MINPVPIGLQWSINVMGSRRTHDLTFKSLNSFTIQSRVKFTKERTSIYREVCAKLVDRGPRRGFYSL